MWTRPPRHLARIVAGAQSVARAAAILRIVAGGREAGLGLSTIARLAGLHRPTVHRLLAALVAEGLVERRPRTARYALGAEIPLLALSRGTRPTLLEAADPWLQEAADRIGDTLFLTLRTGFDTICIARRFGSYPIQVLVIDVGDRRPLGISSAGIAMLAACPDDEVRAILAENRPRLTPPRPGVQRVEAGIAEARRLGFALRAPGLVPGTRAISVAFRDAAGAAVGAVTVTAVSARLSPGRVDAVLPILSDLVRHLAGGGAAPHGTATSV